MPLPKRRRLSPNLAGQPNPDHVETDSETGADTWDGNYPPVETKEPTSNTGSLDFGPMAEMASARGPLYDYMDKREERDDVIRDDMMIDLLRNIGVGLHTEPREHTHILREMWRLLSGHRWYEISAAGPVASGVEAQIRFSEEIRAGQLFQMRAIRASAPAGSQLTIYSNRVTQANLEEVVTNIQLASVEIPGENVIPGPCQLWAVVTGATANGEANVKIEGNLIEREAFRH